MRFEGRVRGRWRAVGLARLIDVTTQELRVLWFANDDLSVGHLLGKHARDALERAACAVSSYPIIEAHASEVFHDLARGRAGMEIWIGFVLELAGEKPAVRLRQLNCFDHHAHSALRLGREHHLGTKETHKPAPLDAELLGHRHDEWVAFLR